MIVVKQLVKSKSLDSDFCENIFNQCMYMCKCKDCVNTVSIASESIIIIASME